MKSFLYLLFIALFSAIHLSAQTKLIAHKSHGGSDLDFQEALENDEVLLNSNLGETPMMIFMQLHLDSVAKINDSTTIIVMKQVFGERSKDFKYPDSDCVFNLSSYTVELLFEAGLYTLVNHPIFSQDITADELRSKIDSSGCFGNEAKTVKVQGYKNMDAKEDSKKRRKKDKGSFLLPFIDFQGPFTGMLLISAGILVFLIRRNQRKLRVIPVRK